MKHAVPAVLFFAAACGAPENQIVTTAIVHQPCAPLRVLPPDGASALQLDAITGARMMWNDQGFTQLRGDGDLEPISVRFEKAAAFFHGFYDPDTGEVLINDGEDSAAVLAIVIAHELGHAMGLAHVPESERPSVMNPGNVALPVLPADSQALEARCPSR